MRPPSATDCVDDYRPVPLSVTSSGLKVLPYVTVATPGIAPVAVGVKFTKSVQLAWAPSVAPQVPPAIEKSPLVERVRDRADARLLVKVTVCAALVVPAVSVPKLRLAGDAAKGDTPTPKTS